MTGRELWRRQYELHHADPSKHAHPNADSARLVPTCVVEGCDQEATKEMQVTASAQVFQPLLYVLQEVDMKIGLCDGHHDLLTHDVLGRLSVA